MCVGEQPEVFVVIGDGTYLMSPTELFTAAQERIKLTVLVLDNGGYQSISRLALGKAGASAGNEFRGREDGDRLPRGERVSVDFVANAKSLGCQSVLVEDGEQLRGALSDARRHAGTTVIVCPTEPGRSLLGSGAFWDIGVAEVSGDPATRAAAAEHLQAAKARRHY
jgi:3D-(3,5/4)-trihydroxycyclohexane-1,2-dione acylhydrolase (decyclizing)